MKISIVIPTYNCGQYVKKAIDSVLNQPYPNKEIIVIDGGSTDDTLNILKEYGEKISFISEKDSGQSDAINKGFKMAKGEIVAWLNADDFYEADIFHDIVSAFQKDPHIYLVYGKCRSISSGDSYINTPPSQITALNLINKGNLLYGPACFFKAEAVKNCGYLDEKINYWMDYELFIRLIMGGGTVYIDRIFANFTIRDGQKSDLKNIILMDKELLSISHKYGGRFLNRIRVASWYHRLINLIK